MGKKRINENESMKVVVVVVVVWLPLFPYSPRPTTGVWGLFHVSTSQRSTFCISHGEATCCEGSKRLLRFDSLPSKRGLRLLDVVGRLLVLLLSHQGTRSRVDLVMSSRW